MRQRDQVFAEGALNVREGHGRAVESHVFAVILHALQAVLAGLTRARRRDGDKLAFGEARHVVAEVGDNA